MRIKHKKTGVEQEVARDKWEMHPGDYGLSRDEWEILEEGDPVIWVQFMPNGKKREVKIADRETVEEIVKKAPTKYTYIELDEGKLRPIVPIKNKRPSLNIREEKNHLVKDESNSGIDGEKSEIVKLSDEILMFLLKWRKERDPNLKFWLRQRDSSRSKEKRLSEGQWFQGSGYIFVGFTKIGDVNMTQAIGFVVNFMEGQISSKYLELIYRKKGYDEKLLKCFDAIVLNFQSSLEDKRQYKFDYNHDSWQRALTYFLTVDKPKIDLEIASHGLKEEFGITEAEFDKMLQKTLSIREKLGYEPIEWIDIDEADNSDTDEPDSAEYDTDAEIVPDTIAKTDELGRKLLIEILYDKVEKLWDKTNDNQPYTILLNGEWGSGKSSMLYYLEELLSENKWTVVQYNAWRNQRFEDPWWILVNKVSKEVPSDASDGSRSHSHNYWRFKNIYSMTYVGALFTSVLLFVGLAKDWFGNESIGYYAGLIGLIGSMGVTINGALKNVFRKKSLTELQMKTANDPLEPYKKRFEEVVKGKKVAIFIDDLDRCEVEPTVKLLEGIQTLFKDSKVLYVIAADGQWVSNCFDKKYHEFGALVSEGQTVGNQFLQKTFQLVLDVPKLSKDKMKSYLELQLGRPNGSDKAEQEPAEMNYHEEEIRKEKNISKLSKISAKGDEHSRKVAAEQIEAVIEENSAELEHSLVKFHEDHELPVNPRQIKRLINLYTMKMQELGTSGVLESLNEEKVLKYVLFCTEYPKYYNELKSQTIEQFKANHEGIEDMLNPLTLKEIKGLL